MRHLSKKDIFYILMGYMEAKGRLDYICNQYTFCYKFDDIYLAYVTYRKESPSNPEDIITELIHPVTDQGLSTDEVSREIDSIIKKIDKLRTDDRPDEVPF